MYTSLKFNIITAALLVSGLFGSSVALAQPSPAQLVEQLQRAGADYLSNIDRVAITVEHDFVGEETSYYTKEIIDGHPVLVPDDEDDYEMIGWVGYGSPEIVAFVGGASSISTERVDGKAMYRILVDDPAVFEQLDMNSDFADDFDDEVEAEIKSAVAWLGQDDMLFYRMEFTMANEQGAEFTMNMYMEDYQTFNGMPIAMSTRMEIEGWQNMVSDEEMAEGMEAMQQMMKELENMPEAQREMIMQQMGPQIEQFKQMMDGDGPTGMTMRITNVAINP